MKFVRISCDFLFGVLLIGGAPLCAMALSIFLIFLSPCPAIISEWIGFVFQGVVFIPAVAAFAYAIRFRLRRRLLPKGVVVLEVLLGLIGALFLFSGYGVLMVYAIYHWLKV